MPEHPLPLAWDLFADDWRTFRLDRLRPRIPNGPSFAARPLPAADAQTHLGARAKGSTGRDEWPCIGEVAIDLPAVEVATWIGVDGTVTAVDEERCLVRLGSWSWTGLLASLARFDAPFRIKGPQELLDAAAVLEQRLRAAASAVR